MIDQGQPDSPLRDTEYRKDPARTWEHLMNAYKAHEARIRWMREQVGDHPTPLALTECHFALPGRNRCEVLSSWAAGVAYAWLRNMGALGHSILADEVAGAFEVSRNTASKKAREVDDALQGLFLEAAANAPG